MAHAADAGGQSHTLVGDRSGGSAGTAKRVQNPSFARRENLLVVSVVSSASQPQGRWSPPTGGRRTDRDALQVSTAAREERMHPQPRQRDRREWRDDPTRTNTSGRSHHVTVEAVRDAAHRVLVEGHGHSPPIRSRTGARSQTRTGTHSHSRTWRLRRPDSPARAASTHSPCSVATLRGREGLHDGGKNRHRLQTEGAGEVTSKTACASSPCRSPRTGRIERQTVGELAAGVDVPRVGGGRHEAGGRA